MILLLLVGGIYFYKTYALYEEKKEYNVLKGIVPNFTTLTIKYIVNGKETVTPPSKSESTLSQIKCSGVKNYSWDNELWNVNYNQKDVMEKDIVCTVTFIKTTVNDSVELANYISYTPSNTSYKISTAMTGYSVEQTINPSELNLWRVIKKNEDGTVDCVSENVSSNQIIFNGAAGGRGKLINSLKSIASAYETEGITSGSYHVGGSASGYTADTDLINLALGTLVSYLPNTETAASYWLAAINTTYSGDRWEYQNGLTVNTVGGIVPATFVTYKAWYSNYEWRVDSYGAPSASIRPIVSFKSEITVFGEGTKENPWRFVN